MAQCKMQGPNTRGPGMLIRAHHEVSVKQDRKESAAVHTDNTLKINNSHSRALTIMDAPKEKVRPLACAGRRKRLCREP